MIREDLRAAVRHAVRRPLFTLGVTLALAVAIGAATTALGLARAVLWRPLPFGDAERLVFVWERTGRDGDLRPARVTAYRYAAWRDATDSPFSAIAMFGAAGFTLDTPAGAQSVRGVRVSAGYFKTLDIAPALGRTFVPADETPGNEFVVVLSHGFWREQLGGRPDVIGTPVLLSGDRYTVIGVMPPAVFPGWPVNPATVTIDPESQRFWVPIARTPDLDRGARAHVFGVVGRLAPGVTSAQARERLDRFTDSSAPDAHLTHVAPFRDQFVRDARTPLLILAGAALAVLLMACANLAALYVSSFEARRAEFSVRAAIGAGIGRLTRQVTLEALIPALAGGVGGLVIARAALASLPHLLPTTVPFLTVPRVDAPLAVTAGILAAIAAGITAAWPLTRIIGSAPAPRGVADRPRAAVTRVLVVTQVAVAMPLMMAAALLGQSLESIERQDPGFALDNVLIADVGIPSATPVDLPRLVAAEQALLDAVARAPRITAVAAAYDHPLEANWSESPTVLGDPTAPEDRREAQLRIVSPGYFEALEVAVLHGRAFTDRDALGAPGAAVVNEAFARELGGRVIGRRIQTGTPQGFYGNAAPREFAIVGIVANERFRGLEIPVEPAFYLSTRQFPQTGIVLLARTHGDPLATVADVRSALRSVNGAVTFSRPTTLEGILGTQMAPRRLTTSVTGGFAVAALALAVLGLYGLLAVLVASRRKEIGVRLALGATPGRVARGVLREAVVSTGAGAATGVVLALATGRVLTSLLVDVSVSDPLTIALVAAMLVGTSLAAALAPAIRAARIDPISALRAD